MRYEEAGDEIVGLKNTLTELESLRKRDEEYFTKKVEEMNN